MIHLPHGPATSVTIHSKSPIFHVYIHIITYYNKYIYIYTHICMFIIHIQYIRLSDLRNQARFQLQISISQAFETPSFGGRTSKLVLRQVWPVGPGPRVRLVSFNLFGYILSDMDYHAWYEPPC